MEFTKAERHEIYKRAYELHLEDIKISRELKENLNGMCFEMCNAAEEIFLIEIGDYSELRTILPEFYNLKPKEKSIGEHWWKINWYNKIRIKKYKLIIEQTKP